MQDTDAIRFRQILERWPGKSSETGRFHPAVWHMLDVGGVALNLLRIRRNSVKKRLWKESWEQAMAFLVALHDIGKISCSFQSMMLKQPSQGGRRWPHWQHSYRLLKDNDNLFKGKLGSSEEVRVILYKAVAGHHGGPPQHLDSRHIRTQRISIGEEAREDARMAIEEIAKCFPEANLNGLEEDTASKLSWQLSGLTVQSDWIGSNPDWFPPKDEAIPIREYWSSTCKCAQDAIRKAHLGRAKLLEDAAFRVLEKTNTPRPMQEVAGSINFPDDGPVMALIEDATGAGKTEASLILAARLIKSGKAKGLFFALPTMATSNAMLERLEHIVPRLFDGQPSLALAHGRAKFSERFREIQGRDGSDPIDESGVSCGRWLADDKRLVLLAEVGVGTIDQALMAVLPTRFNTLRLWALSEQVLIVDEAHSYDPYTRTQLERLLQFQAMLGGSAIVMTATLPRSRRDKLVAAFQEGLGDSHRQLTATSDAYPVISIIGSGVAKSRPVSPAQETCRRVKVRRFGTTEAAADMISRASKKGAACVWIRNAVDDAMAGVEILRSAGIEAELLHARFALCDRLEKERRLQDKFGREGRDRAGGVLVATQVVEQSLDIDFDVMVSDLAPIEALVQRAGRLWRHMDRRPQRDRPVDSPILYVLSPDPEPAKVDDQWLRQILPSGSWVYPRDIQWRTARALFSREHITMPADLRSLIEEVHGDMCEALPRGLEHVEEETIGNRHAETWNALNRLIDPSLDYAQSRMAKVFDDERYPTRLGELQVTLALARYNDGTLGPYSGELGLRGWGLSEVQVSERRYRPFRDALDQDAPEIADAKSGWAKGRKKFVRIAIVKGNGRICDGLRYSQNQGLLFERKSDD